MRNSKYDIILIGGGGHCKACIDVIEMQNLYNIAGIIDIAEKVGQTILGYPVIGCDENIEDIAKQYNNYLITIGQIKSFMKRYKLFDQIKKVNGVFPVIISPLAHVSKHASIQEGSIIMHGTIVNANANIGSNCIINNNALIEHDVTIENHCHVSTGAIINGNSVVKAGSFIGSNATVIESMIIEENSFIKANSLAQ